MIRECVCDQVKLIKEKWILSRILYEVRGKWCIIDKVSVKLYFNFSVPV